MAKCKPLSYGPNLENSDEYDVASYTLNEAEAAELAFNILRHYNRVFKPVGIEATRATLENEKP